MIGSGFALGPGGKGSNQAVAAARAGARVRIVSRLGQDAFGEMARRLWDQAGIDHSLVSVTETPTGSAAIVIDEKRGENAIIVVPGACYTLRPDDVEQLSGAIRFATVFLAQLELPLDTVKRGLKLARAAGLLTVLNPAPAPDDWQDDELLTLTDVLIPNETEAAMLTGLAVSSPEQALAAARQLQDRGAASVIVTLGERGALVCERGMDPVLLDAFHAGTCVETAGAGDAFCGAFAAELAGGSGVAAAARFGCAAAGISVTRSGTAASMPQRSEIEAILALQRG